MEHKRGTTYDENSLACILCWPQACDGQKTRDAIAKSTLISDAISPEAHARENSKKEMTPLLVMFDFIWCMESHRPEISKEQIIIQLQ